MLRKRLAEKKEEEALRRDAQELAEVSGAVAAINSSFNNNFENKVADPQPPNVHNNEGLRNRRNGEEVHDVHNNLRGITVLRSGPMNRPPEEHVESYL